MAEGDLFNDNLPQVIIQFNEVDEFFLMEFWPQYVINATVIDGDIRRALPQIRIPRHFTAVNAGFFVDLLRRSLNQLAQYSLTHGPYHNPLLYMLAWNADYWSIAFYASGEALEIAFYPVYINTPSTSESSTDDEQPGPSHLVGNSEARAGGSSTSESSKRDEQPGPSRLVGNSEARAGGSSTSESSKRDEQPGPSRLVGNSEARAGGSSTSESSKRDEQPGPSRLVGNSEARAGGSSTSESSKRDEQPGHSVLPNNNEDRAGGSRTSADQSSGSQVKTREGVKGKRAHGRSESRQRKKRRLDHNPNSLPMLMDNSPETRWETHMNRTSTDDEQPGPSNLVNSSKARPGGSRTSSCRSERRQWKRWRPDHWSDSDSDSSSDSLSSGFSSPASLEETSSDDEQPGPSHRENSEARASADQISQDESRQGATISELPDTQSKRRRSDHQSDSLMDSLISECSQMYISTPPAACGKTKSTNKEDELSQLVNNTEARAEGSRASSDQSSDSQDEMRRGVKRKRKTSSRSESRERKKKKLDHCSGSDLNDDQPGPSVRDSNEARAEGSRAPDQSTGSQIEARQGLKRNTSDRSEIRERGKNRLDDSSGSDLNDDQPGPSVRDSNEARAEGSRAPDQSTGSQIEARQGLKRKKKDVWQVRK